MDIKERGDGAGGGGTVRTRRSGETGNCGCSILQTKQKLQIESDIKKLVTSVKSC